MLILKRPWTIQPQTPVSVAPGGPRHLIYGTQPGSVDGGVWAPRNGPTATTGLAGAASKFDRTAQQAFLTPARGIAGTGFTLFAVVKRNATVSNQFFLNVAASSGNQRAILYFALAGGGEHRVYFFVGSGATFGQAGATSDERDTSSYHVIIARAISTTLRDLFYDGRSLGSETTSVSMAAPSHVSLGGLYNDGAWNGTDYTSADVAAAGVFPYALSDSQVSSMSRSLMAWTQWLQPREIWVPQNAAAAVAGNAPRYMHRTQHGIS